MDHRGWIPEFLFYCRGMAIYSIYSNMIYIYTIYTQCIFGKTTGLNTFSYFSLGDLKGLPEHDPDYVQRMATPLFIFSKSDEGLATWTIWGVPTPPRSTNPLFFVVKTIDLVGVYDQQFQGTMFLMFFDFLGFEASFSLSGYIPYMDPIGMNFNLRTNLKHANAKC